MDLDSHAAPARAAPSRVTPFARPLRSVNEVPSLLASPGPLESMLKTTTETGGIGPFSIQPTRTLIRPSATYNGPFRVRSGFGEPSASRPPPRSGANSSDHRGDDGRRPPSCRDTTSEIISMYGSDSQRSASSSLLLPFDDLAQRSYSMTSCSSRVLPHQKPGRVLQDNTNQNSLQRPRSPFPYPTRLKRPGVRPCSPALTDNGVDYSRMRTIHNSYKPVYPADGRRPTTKMSRFRANSPGFSYLRHDGIPGSQISRTMSTNGLSGGRNKYHGRYDRSTSEQSTSSSSLTSIVDMYRPPSCAPSAQSLPLQSQTYGTFYYDYTEDFDQCTRPAVAPAPLAPVPTRLPSLRRAKVLNDSFDAALQVPVDHEFTPSHQYPSDNHRRLGSHASSHPSRHRLLSREYADSNTDPLAKRVVMPTADLPAGQTGCLYANSTVGNNLDQSGSDTFVDYTMCLPRQTSPDIAINNVHSIPEPPTRHVSPMSLSSKRGARIDSIEPGLSDLASFVRRFDKAADFEDEDETDVLSPADMAVGHPTKSPQHFPGTDSISSEGDGHNGIGLGNNEDANGKELLAGFRGHKRHPAIPNIHPDQIPALDGLCSSDVARRSSVGGGSHTPKQTTGRLRLQSSAPQLMKALPPVPSASVRSESYIGDRSAEDVEQPAELSALELSSITASGEECQSTTPGKGKLRLRVSRGAMVRAQVELKHDLSHITPRPAVASYGSCSEPLVLPPLEIYSLDSNFGIEANAGGHAQNQASRRASTVSGSGSGPTPGTSLMMLSSYIEGQDLGKTPGDVQTPTPNDSPAASMNLRSLLSGRGSARKSPLGLRKRISDLRVRAAEGRMRSTEPPCLTRDGQEGAKPVPPPMAFAAGQNDVANTLSEDTGEVDSRSTVSRGFRGRVFRWMRAVRHPVMVACAGLRKRG